MHPTAPACHNIDNWHWTEKDYTEWADKQLKELLTFTQKNDTNDIEFSVDEVKGSAFKYIRKNRVHISYDYKVVLNYKFKQPGQDIVEGTIRIEPFVDDDVDDWEYEMKIKDARKLTPDQLSMVREFVTKSVVLPRIQTFVDEFDKQE